MFKLIGKSLAVFATCFVAARSSNISNRTTPASTYPNFTTVDVAASLLLDGLHPNVAGYAKMWAVIAPLLNESLQ